MSVSTARSSNNTVHAAANGNPKIVATYDYRDERGQLLYQSVRREPGADGAKKDFRQRQPNGNGGWTWQLNGVRLIPYRLPELASDLSRPVFIVEGEKDADNLASIGLMATTNPMGAGKWRAEFNQFFTGREVLILPDNDDLGRKHAAEVARQLKSVAKSVTVVELPDLPPKGDVSDWLGAPGNDKLKLLELVNARVNAEGDGHGDAWEGQRPPAKAEPPPPPVGTLLSTVKPERVDWLWRGRIPRGKLTILDGDPGLGKSVLTMELAARVSAGLALPDGTSGNNAAGVVILNAEDGLADTVLPRLLAAGAIPERVLALDKVPADNGDRLPTLPADLPWLKRAMDQVKAALVVIDPLMAFLAGEVNGHKDQDVRRALHPLAALATETGAAVLVVRHLNKAAGGNPLYRGGGSIGIIGAARSGLLVAKDPDNGDQRVLASTKSNLAKLPPALSFSLESDLEGRLRIGWIGESAHTAASLLAVSQDDEEKDAVGEAVEVLREILSAGPVDADRAKKEAHKAGISERTLQRAKAQLRVKSHKRHFAGTWAWELPSSVAETAEECQT